MYMYVYCICIRLDRYIEIIWNAQGFQTVQYIETNMMNIHLRIVVKISDPIEIW
jgi:hypothetical protein